MCPFSIYSLITTINHHCQQIFPNYPGTGYTIIRHHLWSFYYSGWAEINKSQYSNLMMTRNTEKESCTQILEIHGAMVCYHQRSTCWKLDHQPVLLFGGFGTFKREGLGGRKLGTSDPFSLCLLPSLHTENRFPLPRVPTMMYCLAISPKAMDQMTMDWKLQTCEPKSTFSLFKVIISSILW